MAQEETKIQTPVEQKIEWLRQDRRRITEHISWLIRHHDILNAIGIVPSRFVDSVDFNNPNRQQILEIIKAFPGTWRKSINDWEKERMDYVRDEKDDSGVTLRIYAGDLPPCCKLVEEWVDVPAQPATRQLRKVVKCPDPLPQTEAEAV